MILILVILVALLGHGYIWVAFVNRLHGCSWSKDSVNKATRFCMCCFLGLPVLVLIRWNVEGFGTIAYSDLSRSPLKAYFYLCACWGVIKLLLLRWATRHRNRPDTLLSNHQVPSKQVTGLGREMFHGTYPRCLSYLPGNQFLKLCVDYKQLKIRRLHKKHSGIRIVQISDLHMTGRVDKKWYVTVIDQVNHLDPDVVVITGDILENETCWPWLTDSLARLRSKLGVYFILGNHDYYVDSGQTCQLLMDAGLQYLHGGWLETQWNGAPVALVGNELPWGSKGEDPLPVLPRDEERLPLKIALLHTPDQFSWACKHDIDLAMAGHTHGGQFRLPVLGPVACPSLYGIRYASGVFRRENTVLHVTRGVSSKMPLRWNCPPEIAVLELVSGG